MNKILFLPDNYEAPKSSNFYMKFQEGENKFRILSQPILGWEDWQDKKPLRYKFNEKPAKPVDAKKPIKHFWAMVVWNYNEEEIQILHLTQATIRKSLESLCQDSDWGAPYFFDLKVIKTGEGMETEYVLNPLPHKKLATHIQDRFNERRCNLDALYYNDDPFSKEHTVYTPGIFSEEQIVEVKKDEPCELSMVLDECDEKYKTWFYNNIQTQYKTQKLSELPKEVYKKAMVSAEINMNENHSKQRQAYNEVPDFMMEQA
jgi:hypothetical protein